MDKAAKQEVDQAVEEAKASPEPDMKELWTEIYIAGTEPETMRGITADEIQRF